MLPAFNNLPYIHVCTGQSYGVIDLISSCSTLDIDFYEDWYDKKLLMHRQFTIQSLGNSEILNLNIQNLYKMQIEFQDCFKDLVIHSFDRLQNVLNLKLKAIKTCKQQREDYEVKWK